MRSEKDSASEGEAASDVDSTKKGELEDPTGGGAAAAAARKAARGALATLLLRAASFACTQAALRSADPSALGRAMVQLDLLLTTVLFVSREGFRLALTRNLAPGGAGAGDSSDGESAFWNAAWCSVPAATAASLLALGWHLLAELPKSELTRLSDAQISEHLSPQQQTEEHSA